MAINLIDLLSKEFAGDVLGKVASNIGEPENKVQTAVGGLAPALVGALANKATTSQGLGEIFDLMRTSGFDGSQPRGLGSLLSGGGTLTDLVTRGAPLVAALFGGRQGGVTDWLASWAGIGSRSSSSLLALAAPLVLNLLGSQARTSGGFTQSVVGELLGGQAAFVRDKAPAGLAAALGLPDFSKLGVVPRTVPAAPRVEPARRPVTWWPWLAIPVLAVLGWWWFAGREPAGTINPRMAIVNDEGRIACTASVRDETTRDAILQALRSAFGASSTCDITLDPNIRKIAWLPNLDKIMAALKRPGTDLQVDGNTIQLGGWLSAADRTAIGDELRGLFGTDYAIGEAVDKAASYITEAKTRAMAALGTMGTAFSADSFIGAMNMAVINFATGSAEIPADSQDLIARAAEALKNAPKGTRIEIGGHTDNVGDAASNLKLSEDRANAVRQALVGAGVDGSVLVAKGYGDTKPVATNDTEYGRFRNRRIEYSVAPTSTTSGS